MTSLADVSIMNRDLKVEDADGNLVDRGDFGWTSNGGYYGLEEGDSVYVDDRLIFRAEKPLRKE